MKTTSSLQDCVLTPVPRAAAWLGAAGLIPVLVGSVALWTLPSVHALRFIDPLVGYGAVILAFMGAVHWGLAMAVESKSGTTRWFALSVMPALLGWCATMMAPPQGLALLAAAFTAVYALDRFAIAAHLAPSWYQRLRTPLTIIVVASLSAAALAAWTRLPTQSG